MGLKVTLQKSILILEFLKYTKCHTGIMCNNPDLLSLCLQLDLYYSLFFLEFAFSWGKSRKQRRNT